MSHFIDMRGFGLLNERGFWDPKDMVVSPIGDPNVDPNIL